MTSRDAINDIVNNVATGRMSRRAAIRRAAGLGLSVSAVSAALMAQSASGQSTPASPAAEAVVYEPQGPQVETLVYWTRSSADTSPNEWDALVAVAAAYTESIGTQIELVTVPDADFRNRLSLAAPQGDGPDVLGPIAHDWIGELAFQNIAQTWTPETISGSSDIQQAALDAVTVNGQIYGVPLYSEALALVYNRDLTPDAPSTWDDLVATATELTSGEQYGFAFPITTQYYEGPFFFAFGSYIFRYENGTFDTADIGLNNEGGVEAAKFLRDMYANQTPPQPESVLDQANGGGFIDGLMEAGQLAMTIAGPWREPPLTAAGINYGVATLPTLPNGNPLTPFVGYQAVVANAYGEQLDAATDFINFHASTAGVELTLAGFNKAPVRTSALPAAVALNPNFEQWIAQAESGVPMPNIPAMGQVWTPWGDAMLGILQNNSSDEEVKALLDTAVEQIKANIEQSQS